MKSILNKSYHRRRALWSSFVTCGCGCVFNFLSIKSKYTPFIFSPTVKSKQGESTWADRWGIFIYICQTVFPFFFSTVEADDVIQQAKLCLPACLLSNTPTNLLTGGGGGGGRRGKEILSAGLSCSELDGKDKQTPNKCSTTQTLLHH